MKKVVVTGIGAITPLGNTFTESWSYICAGKSGIKQITGFDASRLPWKIAGEVADFDGKAYLSGKELKRLDPFVHYAVAASVMAAEDAGLRNSSKLQVESYRSAGEGSLLESAGVIIGSSRGGISTIEKALIGDFMNKDCSLSTVGRRTRKRLSPYLMPSTTISMAASCVAQRLGVRGECLGISNACASGTNAIGEAYRIIRHGLSSLLIAGGSEAPVCRLCVEGYGTAGALSKNAAFRGGTPVTPRPFDRSRDGFVLAEGASVLVLEEYEHALKRNARIYGEMIAYGNTSDAFHMTKPDPEGEARAMIVAIKEAGIKPGEADYINTHGTGTRLGDAVEAEAIRRVFGRRASKIPASALKSMTGHMLAASGAFEVACTLMSMEEGIIPPTINVDDKDPACDINIVTKRREADIRIALSNSFGFGGVNAVVVLKKV